MHLTPSSDARGRAIVRAAQEAGYKASFGKAMGVPRVSVQCPEGEERPVLDLALKIDPFLKQR